MSDTEEVITEESIPLIVKTPVRTYKNTLIHASSIADIGKYIHYIF